jgi:hypothetical protein
LEKRNQLKKLEEQMIPQEKVEDIVKLFGMPE